MELIVGVLTLLLFCFVFSTTIVEFLQLVMMPIALNTANRKNIPAKWYWLMLVPYVGIVFAYHIACAPENHST